MKISEISEITKMSADTLRYYEKEALIGPIKKVNGIREYSEHDLSRVQFIQHMRNAGMKMTTLKRYIDLVDIGDSTEPERKLILEEHQQFLEAKIQQLEEVHEVIKRKIANYDSHMRHAERQINRKTN